MSPTRSWFEDSRTQEQEGCGTAYDLLTHDFIKETRQKEGRGLGREQRNPLEQIWKIPRAGPTSLTLVSYLAPVAHVPAGTGTEVASLGGLGPLKGSTVGVHPGAALHAAPVGPQAAGGGALQQAGRRREGRS